MNLKKYIVQLLAAAAGAVALLVPASGDESAISVTIDNEIVKWEDAMPFIQDNRTLVPLRAVAEAMGLQVDWDDVEKCVSFSVSSRPDQAWLDELEQDAPQLFLAQTTVKMYVGQADYKVVNLWAAYDADGNITGVQEEILPMEMDTAVVLEDNRIYAPIRYMAEAFGYEVGWDTESRMVQIAERMDASWKGGLYYVADEGRVVVATGALENIASLTLRSATIRNINMDTAAEPLTLEQMPAEDAAAFQKTQAYLKNIGDDLTAYSAAVAVKAGQQYHVHVTLEIVKTNGVVQENYLDLTIDAE